MQRPKTVIYELAEKSSPKIEELANIKPRVGDGKNRRSVEDIITIYGLLVLKKFKLSMILAADCCRVPSFKDMDIGKLSNKIDDIRALLSSEMSNLSLNSRRA